MTLFRDFISWHFHDFCSFSLCLLHFLVVSDHKGNLKRLLDSGDQSVS